MIVAISTHPETEKVERFGHDFPVLLVDLEGMEVRGSRVIESETGTSSARAESLKDADILICTELGQGEEDVLRQFGVGIAYCDEGVDVSAALASLAHQLFGGGGCCGGHHHAEGEHDHAQAGGCCGGHGRGGHGRAEPHASEGGCCGGHGHEHAEAQSSEGGCCGGGGKHAHGGGGCGCSSGEEQAASGGGCCGGHGHGKTEESAHAGHRHGGCGCRN